MITQFIKVSFLFFGIVVLAQPATEVYLMDLEQTEDQLTISNFKNLSQNPGYDNQPSFFDDDTVIYAFTKNGNTEIMISSVHTAEKISYFEPTEGGEYSPQLIPESGRISAVRLDKNGKQRLYDYTPGKDIVKMVVEDLRVAYYSYYGPDKILASVLSDQGLDLVLADLKTNVVDTLLEGSGRSIHRVPNSKAMSYTAVNEEQNHEIYQFDMESTESFFVAQLPIGVQDHIWLSDSKLLCGSGDKLYLYDLFGSGDWKLAVDLSEYKIKDITRLAVSPTGTKLAVVAEPPSETKKE